jgi:hypothetical protein
MKNLPLAHIGPDPGPEGLENQGWRDISYRSKLTPSWRLGPTGEIEVEPSRRLRPLSPLRAVLEASRNGTLRAHHSDTSHPKDARAGWLAAPKYMSKAWAVLLMRAKRLV